MAENDNSLAPASEKENQSVGLATLLGSSSHTTKPINNENENLVTMTPLAQPSFNRSIDVPIDPMEALATSSSRKKGRPPGSKNHPKPTEENNDPMKLISIEIQPGNDVVETLIHLAHSRQASIIVTGGSGLVSDVTLLEPLTRALIPPIEGMYRMTSLYGIYNINSICPLVSPQFITERPCSSFSLCYVNNLGQAFGGIVGGKVKAAGVVLVNVIFLKKAEFHRLALINEIFYENEVWAPINRPPRPLPPPSDVNVMQWNCSTRNDN